MRSGFAEINFNNTFKSHSVNSKDNLKYNQCYVPTLKAEKPLCLLVDRYGV